MNAAKKLRRRFSFLGLVLALSIAVAMIVGCSTNTTSYDDQVPVDDKLSFLVESTNGESANATLGLFDLLSTLVNKIIGVVGGVINLDIDGTMARFEVPAGALTRPTRISLNVKKLGTPAGNLFVYDCGPDGTQFKVDARLSQQMPAGRKYAYLYYFNEATSKWELQEVVNVSGGYATFKIKHFSKYGIS
ncbi:MAG: hypothetical protein WBP29_14330 [Candidatus Zixiibacteriota bacterium]